MNDVVGLAECLDLCETLQRQMESDCQIPPDCLGAKCDLRMNERGRISWRH